MALNSSLNGHHHEPCPLCGETLEAPTGDRPHYRCSWCGIMPTRNFLRVRRERRERRRKMLPPGRGEIRTFHGFECRACGEVVRGSYKGLVDGEEIAIRCPECLEIDRFTAGAGA